MICGSYFGFYEPQTILWLIDELQNICFPSAKNHTSLFCGSYFEFYELQNSLWFIHEPQNISFPSAKLSNSPKT